MNKSSRTFILGHRYHVVIVGANFAGLKAASALSSEDFRVTVIDTHPYFEFLPNIHELISGIKKPANLRLPRKSLIEGFGHMFIRDFVTKVDGEKKRIDTATGQKFDYDFCIVAVGGVNNTFGVEGADQYAMPFKSVENCYLIGQKLAQLVKSGERTNIVIVGGNLEGIEALGEILRKYRKFAEVNIAVIEKSSRMLSGTIASVDSEIRGLCQPYNVSFHTGIGVEKVEEKTIHLSSEEILPSDITIWTGGSCAPKIIDESGLNNAPGQWAAVNHCLQSQKYNNIFIAGDAAELPDPISKQAYYAMDMGLLAAENLQHMANGNSSANANLPARPSIVTFGDLSTFLVTDKFAFSGQSLAAIKESIFQLNMVRMDNPIRLGGIFDTAFRINSAATGFVLPSLTSFSALKRLGKLKLLN
jgi:NADH dehydrogenase